MIARCCTQEVRQWQSRCSSTEAQLASATSRAHWTPEAAAFAALERKLDELQADGAARDVGWRGVMREAQELAELKAGMASRKW